MLVQIADVRDDVSWRRLWLDEFCLRVCFIPRHDLAPYGAEMSQHLLNGDVGVHKVLFIEILEVMIVDAGNDLLHPNIGDRLLYLLRLLYFFLLLLKCHDIKWGGGKIDGAGRCRQWV